MNKLTAGVLIPLNPSVFPGEDLILSGLILEIRETLLKLAPVHSNLKMAQPDCLILSPDRTALMAPLVVACQRARNFPIRAVGQPGLQVSGEILDDINMVSNTESCPITQSNRPVTGLFSPPGSRVGKWNERLTRIWESFYQRAWGHELESVLEHFPVEVSCEIARLAFHARQEILGGDKWTRGKQPGNETLNFAASPESAFRTRKTGTKPREKPPSVVSTKEPGPSWGTEREAKPPGFSVFFAEFLQKIGAVDPLTNNHGSPQGSLLETLVQWARKDEHKR